YVEDLIQIKPDLPDAYKFLSQINEALGDNKAALDNYQKALELKANDNVVVNEWNNSPYPKLNTNRNSFPNSKIANSFVDQNHSNSLNKATELINLNSIELLIDSKLSILASTLQVISEKVNSSQQPSAVINSEMNSLKKEFLEINRKIGMISDKQSDLERLINQTFQQSSNVTNGMNKISTNLQTLSCDINGNFDQLMKKIEDLESLTVQNYHNNYVRDDDEDYSDECDDDQTNNITANNEISMAKKENETREIVTQNSTKVSSSEFFVLPKVHLPDNYDHKTGEEDDEIIYQVDRAKLYIFVDGEYKERGVGCLKLLKNKQNQKFRLVMRRDLVYKVCLNFLLTNNLKFEMRNDHNVSFQCIDHSDINSPEPLTCLLRISEKEKMKKLVELLRKFSASPNSSPNKSANNGKIVENSKANIQKAEKVVKEEDNDCELIFVNEPTPEQKKLIETLKLPLSFFSFENRGPCKGCIGCKVDELSWNNLTRSVVEEESDFKDSSIFTSLQNQFHSVESSEKRIDDIGTKGFSNENSKSFISEKSKLLPQNYQHVTGEENEEVVYEYSNAKLYRIADDEYKERGVGPIKILKKPNKNDYRILMRRNVVLQVVCNHKLDPMLQFKKRLDRPQTCVWITKDYSEVAEGKVETFLLKLKNEKLMDEFLAIINDCIDKIKSDLK
ncbi:hypothetical protein QR98_0008890, partial [Sarcoptes scabiei]